MNGPAVGVVIAGKYLLERPLSRGGMGSVWVARHRDLGTAVAIKFMEPVFIASADARARFEREARAAAHLDSLHVVQVNDYGVDRGIPYIVMELLKGEDLAARLAREGRLSIQVTADILNQMCRALRKAHDLKLVHRDLKPANIFIAEKDETQIVKVLDFGIAKASGTGFAGAATQTGALIGTLHYMSPEQARRSKEVDHRSDLWSLGVIVFRALTGRLPFPGDEIGDVIVKICADPIPVPTAVAPDLPKEVNEFMARALARKQDERFQSVGEFMEALNALARPRLPSSPEPPHKRPSIPVNPPAPAMPSAAPRPPSSTLPAAGAKESALRAAPVSSEPISLSDDGVSIVEESRKGTTFARPSPAQPPISSRDAVSVEEEVDLDPIDAVTGPAPAVGEPLAPTLELPTQRRADPNPMPAQHDGSLSPSLQTLHPLVRTHRLVGTAVAVALLGLLVLGWWLLDEPTPGPTVVSATASVSPPAESVPSPLVTTTATAGSVSPTTPQTLTVSSQASSAPAKGAPSASPKPWRPPSTKPTGEKRIILP